MYGSACVFLSTDMGLFSYVWVYRGLLLMDIGLLSYIYRAVFMDDFGSFFVCI